MKKLLSILLVLVSFVSYGQVVEKQTTYVIKMSEQEYNEYVNGKSNDAVVVKKRHYGNKHNEKSFGAVAGYSAFIGEVSMSNVAWGSYIDFGKFGIEYNASVGLNNKDLLGTEYLNYMTARGSSDITGKEWISGGASRSIGVFVKSPRTNIYYGGGIQVVELIGLRAKSTKYSTNATNTYYSTIANPFDENKIYPYVTIGYIQKLNDLFTIKGGLLVSKTTLGNVGIGINF